MLDGQDSLQYWRQRCRNSCRDRLGALEAGFWIEGGCAVLRLTPPLKCAHHPLYHLHLCAGFEVSLIVSIEPKSSRAQRGFQASVLNQYMLDEIRLSTRMASHVVIPVLTK